MKISNLDDIVEAGLCAGCGICESIAGRESVEMKLSTNGRIRPHSKTALDASTFEQIMQVCPGVTVKGLDENADYPAHPVWGPVISLHRGWASDEKTRFHAAAGGTLTALGMHLIGTGKVDSVLHIAASSEHPALSETRVSITQQEVYDGAQSRYGPGASLTKVHQLLDEGRTIAVLGKPCDINAIRNLQQTSERARKQIPYCLSIFCGGTMSLKMLDTMVEHFGAAPDELRLFRYRGEGWPGTAHMETRDGREFDLTYKEAWLADQMPWKYDLQFRCKICPDAIGETADVSCPDGWIMKDGKPQYEEAPGANLIIARTRAGEELIRDAESAGVLTLEPFSVEQLDEMHDDHRDRKTHWPARMLGLRLTGQPAVQVRGYRLISAVLAAGLGYSLKSFWGTFQRARKGLNREPGFSDKCD
jgi:coenzyme F420 hydrogenase subunit beta